MPYRLSASGNTGARSSTMAQVSRFFVAVIRDFDLAANRSRGNRVNQSFPVFTAVPSMAVMTSPPLNPAFSAGAAGLHALDYDAVRCPRDFNVIWLVPRSSWKLTPMDPRVTRPLLTIWSYTLNRCCGRHRKPDAFVAPSASNDGRVDADDLPGDVDQRAAGVARIDGRVGLQEALELAVDTAAVFRANDPCGYGRVQSEGGSDGQNPITHLHSFGVTQFRKRQFLAGVNLDDRQVGVLVHANTFPGVLGGVTSLSSPEFWWPDDHVVVGKDAALVSTITPEPRLLSAWGCPLSGLAVEKVEEEILTRIILVTLTLAMLSSGFAIHHLRGGDIHDCGANTIHDAGKRIRRRNGVGQRECGSVRSAEIERTAWRTPCHSQSCR